GGGGQGQGHDPGGDVGAEGVEVAVGEVDDPHHAVDQAQAAGDQEEDRCVEERVEEVDEGDVHRRYGRSSGRRRTSGPAWWSFTIRATATVYRPGAASPRSSLAKTPRPA